MKKLSTRKQQLYLASEQDGVSAGAGNSTYDIHEASFGM
jgi:hypothetical protein